MDGHLGAAFSIGGMTRAPEPHDVRPDTAHALLERVARAQASGRAPSLSVGVVRAGAVAWSAGRGLVDQAPPTTDTQYRIGSITKGFTAVLVMRLRDEGRLSLEDRLDEYVPGTVFGDRTIRDLLAHSAGLAAEPPGPWWERSPGKPWTELAETLTPSSLLRPSGQFHYSNVGYGLLGELVARHRGTSWYEALRSEVLDPLDMRRTTYSAEVPAAPGLAVHPFADVVMAEQVQDLGAMAAAGQLWSTVTDLGRWIGLVSGDSGDVLSGDTVAEMRQTQVIADDPTWQSGYGLGFQVLRPGDRELVGHGGSVPGFLAMIVVDVERRTGTVELANATSGAVLCGAELLGILQDHEPALARTWQPADVPAEVLELTGTWHWGPTAFLLRLRGNDRLELAPAGGGAGRATRFRSAADGSWTGLDGYWRGETLRPVRRADGSLSHLDIATFVLTRMPYDPDAPIPGGVPPDPWHTALP